MEVKMTPYFSLWKSCPDISFRKSQTKQVSQYWLNINEMYKQFFYNYSWYIYCIAGILSLLCIYYIVYDCKRRSQLRRRREELQRANERMPQRRRPGAVHRDQAIFRNVIKTVRQYIEHIEPPLESSGLEYGRIYDNIYPDVATN